MPFTLQSPYGDDETRTKDISKIMEEFIETNWDQTKTGVVVTGANGQVAFGVYGDQILQSGKPITLRVYPFFEDVVSLDVANRRQEFVEYLTIDVYVLNNALMRQRDSRAVAIKKWFDELFITRAGNIPKGIYDLQYRGSRVDIDVENTNITRVKARIDVRYVGDIVQT